MATDPTLQALGHSLKNPPFKRLTSTGSNVSERSNTSRSSVAQRSSRYDSQFYKTKLCMFWQNGRCTRKFCKYAHGDGELKRTPDLRKTAMCRNLLTTGSCPKEDCSFAHSLDELRATDKFYKTTMCCFYRYGTCKLGDQCRHAHCRTELRFNYDGTEKRVVSSDSTGSPSDSRTETSDTNWDDLPDMRWERAETMPVGVGTSGRPIGSPANCLTPEQDSDSDLDDFEISHTWERGQTMPPLGRELDGLWGVPRDIKNDAHGKWHLHSQAGVLASPQKKGSSDQARRPSGAGPTYAASPADYADCTGGTLMQLPFLPGMVLVPVQVNQATEIQEAAQGSFVPAQMVFQDMNMVDVSGATMDPNQMMHHTVWGMMPPAGGTPGVFVAAPHSPQHMHPQVDYKEMQARVLQAAMPEVYED